MEQSVISVGIIILGGLGPLLGPFLPFAAALLLL